MSKSIDLTGQIFNNWTVISRAPNNNRGETMWNCKCNCGNIKVVQGYSLRKGKSQSCGCLQKQIMAEKLLEDITGNKYGHLTVLEYVGKDNSRKSLWKCKCDCDAETLIITRGSDLRSGKTISCGCVNSKGEEKIAKILMEHHIPFEKEKTFDTCRYQNTNAYARFDFFVDNKYIIEYDGIQHFQPTFNTFNEENFHNTINHDEFKNQWCKENNIPIIRIKYTQLDTLNIKDLLL